MTELLNCPFCGGGAKKYEETRDEKYAYANVVKVQCTSCGVAISATGDTSKPGYADNSTTESRAVAAWNHRAATKAAAPADAPKRLSEREVRMIALDHISSGSVGEYYEFDAHGLDAFAIDIMNRCRASSVPAIPGTGAASILQELVELRALKAEYDAAPHMHHVYWMRNKLADYQARWPAAWGRAEQCFSAPPSHPSEAKAGEDA